VADNTQSADTMAKLLDISPRRLHQLVDMGVMPKEGRGKYPLVKCVHAYIHYLRDISLKSDTNAPDGKISHKERLTKAQADKAEVEASIVSGATVPIEAVTQTWTNAAANMKSRLLSIPSKSAPLVNAALTVQEAEAIIKKQIFEALEELSQGEIIVELSDESPEPDATT
jgi:phage terminase Nu1 subunit (DNA packaging protein)